MHPLLLYNDSDWACRVNGKSIPENNSYISVTSDNKIMQVRVYRAHEYL